MKPSGSICRVTRLLFPLAVGWGLVAWAPPGTADVSTGLVASYALAGDAADRSGNGNNGTVYGAVPTADRDGRPNGAYSFNGQSASIVVPSSGSLAVTGSQLTMAAWVRVAAGADFSAGWVRFLSKGATQGLYFSDYSLGFDSSGRLTAEFSNSGGAGATGGVVSSESAFSRGGWHHVAATFLSGSVKLYVDGSLAASGTTSAPALNSSARTLVLGGRTQSGTDHQFFSGDLDEVLIYSRALSASDVSELVAPSPTDPGATSKLTLVGGTVAGQTVSPSSRTVTVAPGQSLVGQINVRIDSTWPSNAVMAMGVTPSWGSHATAFRDLGGFSTPVAGLVRTVQFDFTAPAMPGTYVITAAYGAQYTAAQVMSATSWTVGAGTWNDGNDVADWPASMLAEANANGTVQASILYPTGFVSYYIPATAIEVVVQGAPPVGGPQLTAGSGSLCSGQSIVVPVTLAGTASPLAIQFDVTFDPAKLSVAAVQTGSLTSGFSISSSGSSGRVRVAMASGSAAASPSGEVARLTFLGTSALALGGSAVVGVENVTVNDIAGTGRPGTLTCPSRRKGDVNGNGSVSAFDASLILQAVVGSLTLDADQFWAADFNSSGSVTAYDASLVLQCVVYGNCQ